MSERREKVCYDHTEDGAVDMAKVRVEPEGKGYLLEHDELDDALYVIEDDGERTYVLWA